MRKFEKVLLLTISVALVTSATAQDNREILPKGVPDSIGWNLHFEAKQELQMVDIGYAIRFDDSSIWSEPKDLYVRPIGLTPASFGISQASFEYKRFIALVLQDGRYELLPRWAVPQLFLITGYEGNALWLPTDETRNGGEIARIGSNKSKVATSTLRKTKFFPDDPRGSRVTDIWLFVKKK